MTVHTILTEDLYKYIHIRQFAIDNTLIFINKCL